MDDNVHLGFSKFMLNEKSIYCSLHFSYQLGNLNKTGSTVSTSYWSQSGSLLVKDIKVSLLQSQEFPDYVVRKFTLTKIDHPNELVVGQFQFLSWLESGVANDSSVLLAFINKIIKWHGIPKGPKVRISLFFHVLKCYQNNFDITMISQ